MRVHLLRSEHMLQGIRRFGASNDQEAAFLAAFSRDAGYYMRQPTPIKATTLEEVWEKCQNHVDQASPVGRSLMVMDIIEDDDSTLWLITGEGFMRMGPTHWNVP